MNITDTQTLYIIGIVLFLMLFSRSILRLCVGFFVSVSSLMLAVFSLVCCVLLIFVIAAPTVVLTCYVVGKAANGKGTHSRLVEQLCDVKSSKQY